MIIRDYQQQAIDSLEYNRDLIYLATGSGKSIIFKEIATNYLKQNKRVCFIVYGKSIVDQAARKHFNQITDSICMVMGPSKYVENKSLYCCSISTIARNKELSLKLIKECDLFIIDEAHNATADTYKDFLKNIPKEKPVIGLTATPFYIGNRGHSFWENIIHPITIQGLVKKGFLVKPKVFIPEKALSIEGVKKTAGEFNNKQLFIANNNYDTYQGILKLWETFGKGKRTIGFAINRKHAQILTEVFNLAGYPSAYADAETSQPDRLELIKELEDKKILCLFNVNIFSTGVDVPSAECGLMARPTSSLSLWLQQVGRLLRTYEEKEFATIIDCGANSIRLGHPLSDFEPDRKEIRPKGAASSGGTKIKSCPQCGYLTLAASKTCPECGAEFKAEAKEVLPEISDFIEYELETKKNKDREWLNKQVIESNPAIEYLIDRILKYGWKRNSFFFKIDAEIDNAEKYIRFPEWYLDIRRTKS